MTRKHWLYGVVLLSVMAMVAIASVALADTTYVVRSGDSLGRIAARYGTSVRAIADANNIVNANYIYVGQVLTIPDGSGGGSDDGAATTVPVSQQTYTVRYGDTLSGIAARLGVTVADLANLNGIVNANYIYVGQVLQVPGGGGGSQPPTATPPPTTAPPTAEPTQAPPSGEQSYVVRHGDSLASIARRYGTTVNAIAQRNGIINPNYIYVGQVLIIPGSAQNPQPTAVPPTAVPTQSPAQPTAVPTAAPTQPPAATPTTAPLPTAVPTVAPTATPVPPTATPPPANNAAFQLGGQSHHLNNPELMKNIGMDWIKFQHKWGVGNGPGSVAGRISDAHAKGLKVLMAIPGADHNNIDFNMYIEFVRGVAALPDPPDAIEIWNEQNIDREWPNGQISARQYVEQMLKPAYAAIKSANPNVMVISGAPAPTGFFGGGCTASGCDDKPYIEEMAAAGAASAMDCIGIHYNEGILPPSASSGDPRGNPNHYTRYYPTMVKTYLEAFNYEKPLCFTELGYLSGDDYGGVPGGFSWAAGTSIAEHAQWLGEVVTLARQDPNVQMLIIFNVDFTLYETDGDPQAGFAIIRKDKSCPACATIAVAMDK